ncbi:MAG: accessory gene regulator B family protein [Eubacterium sp.]
MLYIIMLFIIRSCTGGYHAQTYFKCNLIYIFLIVYYKIYNFLSKHI